MFFSSSTIRTFAMSPAGQLDGEAAAVPDLAVERDPAAMCLDDIADDRKPEPRGPGVAAFGRLDEPLEDALTLLGPDAGPRVDDRQQDGAVLGGERDPDFAAAGRVAQRVRDQVRQRPGELRLVARDGESAVRQRRREPDVLVAGLQAEEAADACDHLAKVDVAALDGDARRARDRAGAAPRPGAGRDPREPSGGRRAGRERAWSRRARGARWPCEAR